MSDNRFSGDFTDNESVASSSFVGTPLDAGFGSESTVTAGEASKDQHHTYGPRYKTVTHQENASFLEDVEDYRPGGFCPVEIGSNMCGNYEILHKLGHGRHATVWLARDFVKNQWAALKIFKAEYSEQAMAAFEKLLATRLKPLDVMDAHIQIPEDALWVESANGRHVCYVLGLLGPSVIAPTKRKNDQSQRNILLQLVAAVRFLHNRRLRHGDIKPENVLLHPWHVAGITREDMIETLGKPITYEVEPVDQGSATHADLYAPKYLVAPTQNLGRLAKVIKIMVTDMGLAARLDEAASKNDSATAADKTVINKARDNSDVWGLVFMLARMKCSELDDFEQASDLDDNLGQEHYEHELRGLLDSWYDLFANLHLDPYAPGEEDQEIIDIVEETEVTGKMNQLVVDALEGELPQNQLDSLIQLIKAKKFGLNSPVPENQKKAPANLSEEGQQEKRPLRANPREKGDPRPSAASQGSKIPKGKEPVNSTVEKPSSPKKVVKSPKKPEKKSSAKPQNGGQSKPTTTPQVSPERRPRGRPPKRRSSPPRPQTPSPSPAPTTREPSPIPEQPRQPRRRPAIQQRQRPDTPPAQTPPGPRQEPSESHPPPPSPTPSPPSRRSLQGMLDTVTKSLLDLVSWAGLTSSPGNLVFLGFTAGTAVFTVIFAIWLFTIRPPVVRGSVPASGGKASGAAAACAPGHMYVQTRKLSAHSLYFEGVMTFPDDNGDGVECPGLEDVQFDAQIEAFPGGKFVDSWEVTND